MVAFREEYCHISVMAPHKRPVMWKVFPSHDSCMCHAGVMYPLHKPRDNHSIITSSSGNIFRVTGPVWGEVTGWFPSQRPVTRSFDVFFDLHLNHIWANHRDAGDLRRHCAHYDVNTIEFLLLCDWIHVDSNNGTLYVYSSLFSCY